MRKAREKTGKFIGEVEIASLDSVKANDWNPNVVSTATMDGIVHTFKTDGWSKNQALLVWRKDDQGVLRNIIIDGEHKWTAGKRAGFASGPMVFVDGWTEAKAKAWTVKMNRRGDMEEQRLSVLLRDIQSTAEVDDMALEFGFDHEAMLKMLDDGDVNVIQGGSDAKPGDERGAKVLPKSDEAKTNPEGAHVRMVQLFFDEKTEVEFKSLVRNFGAKLSLKSTSDIVLEVMRSAANSTAK